MDPEMTPTPVTSTAAAPRGSALAIPLAIVAGFGMIAAAIFFSGNANQNATGNAALPLNTNGAPETQAIRPVDEDDYIRGNPNAQIVFVEYSDYDCPFCKRFHEETMTQLMNDYGSTGQVAWVYRHFPLEQLHPNASRVALAAECVGELAGNDAFWTFSDLIFGEREINAQTDMTKLESYAVQAGADATAYNTCMSENRHADKVEQDFTDGVNAGAQGTPHTFVMVGGQQGVINGAQPYEVVKTLTENLISQLGGE